MDLFQLKNSINILQDDKIRSLLKYKPFLGVSNFDSGKCLLFDKKRNIESWHNDFKEKGKLYFFIANTSTSTQIEGEHWFLIAFEFDVKNVLYVFNSFGICNTLQTFGYVSKRKNKASADSYSNRRERLNAVLELSDVVWERTTREECQILPKIIDLNGTQQDFSTDECGYHVKRFVLFLYDSVFPLFSKSNSRNGNWHSILSRYISKYKIKLINYDQDKYLIKSESQPILLDNDREVKRFIEESSKAFTDKENHISEHVEFNLSEEEWKNIAQKYKSIYQEISNSDSQKWRIKLERRNLTCELVAIYSKEEMSNTERSLERQTKNVKMSSRKNGKRSKPYGKKRTKVSKRDSTERDLTTYAGTFDEMIRKTNESLSKKLISTLFPSQIRHHDPITNNIEYSGMKENPHYLINTIISLPGEEHSPLSVGDYFLSLGVYLDDKDPYTYTLVKLIKNYFENHPQKRVTGQLLKRIQKDNATKWRYVR